MKILQKQSYILFCLAIFICGGLNSCSVDKTKGQIQPENGEMLKLQVEVSGIVTNQQENQRPKAKISLPKINGKQALTSSQLAAGAVHSFAGFDAQFSVQEGNIVQDKAVQLSSKQNRLSISNLSSNQMDQGTTYRFVLYDSNGNLHSSIAGKAGSKISIDVVKGAEYTWFAYSYNDTRVLEDLNNEANPTIDTDINSDLLFDEGTVTVTGEGDIEKPVKILFKHKVSKVEVILDARGMFAGIKSMDAEFGSNSYLKKGTLNLKSGQFGQHEAVQTEQIPLANRFYDSKDSIKYAVYYTSDETPIPDFEIKINSFTIGLDNGGTRTFDTPVSIKFDLRPDHGKQTNLETNLVESALIVDGVAWARTNLYFSEEDFAYRFRHLYMDAYLGNTNEFWYHKTPFPHSSYSAVGSVDPCTLVYPKNVWRMVKRNEAKNLINRTEGRTKGPDYLGYNAEGPGSPYPGNQLRVEQLGWSKFDPVLGTIFDRTVNGNIWIEDRGSFGVNLAITFDDFGLEGDYISEANVGSMDRIKRNVRCVRAFP